MRTKNIERIIGTVTAAVMTFSWASGTAPVLRQLADRIALSVSANFDYSAEKTAFESENSTYGVPVKLFENTNGLVLEDQPFMDLCKERAQDKDYYSSFSEQAKDDNWLYYMNKDYKLAIIADVPEEGDAPRVGMLIQRDLVPGKMVLTADGLIEKGDETVDRNQRIKLSPDPESSVNVYYYSTTRLR